MPATASSKVFPLSIDIYRQIAGTAADGSFAPTYPLVPSVRRMPCSLSYKSRAVEKASRDFEFVRIGQNNHYEILVPVDPLVSPRDKILYTDLSKNVHTLYVDSSDDTDGLGIHWTIEATEKV